MNTPTSIKPIAPDDDTCIAVTWQRMRWGIWIPDCARTFLDVDAAHVAGEPYAFEMRVLEPEELIYVPLVEWGVPFTGRSMRWRAETPVPVDPTAPIVWIPRAAGTLDVTIIFRKRPIHVDTSSS